MAQKILFVCSDVSSFDFETKYALKDKFRVYSSDECCDLTEKEKKDKLQGWGLLLAMTHKKETYDFFGIPEYKDEIEVYYENNPIILKK